MRAAMSSSSLMMISTSWSSHAIYTRTGTSQCLGPATLWKVTLAQLTVSTLLSDMLSSAVLGATQHTPADASNRATLTFSDENFENDKTIACVLDMLTGRNLKPRLSRPGDCHRIYKVLEFMRKWECKFATSHVIAYVSAMVREKNPVLDHPGRLLQAAAMLDDGDFAFTIIASTGHLATPSHGDLHLDPEFRKKPDSSYLDPRAMSVELKKALPFAYYEALGWAVSRQQLICERLWRTRGFWEEVAKMFKVELVVLQEAGEYRLCMMSGNSPCGD